ncbi:MAG: motility associated factor glycosyltransferase family protein [Spirochaetes bacterium]|nr:motility associated factor glycosyltransferase family protein [Spirochaetota bacterium]
MQDIKYGIEDSKHGEPTLYVCRQICDRVYLHSKYNPLKESDTLKEKFNQDKFDFIFILGAGLGYHLDPLIETSGKFKKIIIIDIISNLEKEIEKNNLLNPLLKIENIVFLTGLEIKDLQEKINAYLNFDNIKGIDVIEHAPSVRAFPDYYTQVKKAIKRSIDQKAGNKATHKAFGKLYLRNIIKNYNSFRSMMPVSAFFDKFKGYPCAVITSGPSIEEYIKEIKAYQNKIFIITVDSALKTLSAYGVEPDFFVSIDPQPFIFEHLFSINSLNTIPVYTVSTHNLVIENLSASKQKRIPQMLSLNSHPLSQVIEELFPGKTGSIDSKTGTVAGDAVMACIKMGFKNTALFGFDFSFPDFKIYPRGTAYQSRFNNACSRLNTSETVNFNYIMKTSKGTKYENKFTRKSFLLYREYMENLLKNNNCGIYNINSRGISFGIPDIKTDQFFENYCKMEINKKNIINQILLKTKPLENLIDFELIKNTLNNETAFREFLKASLDNSSGQTTNTVRSLFKSLIR